VSVVVELDVEDQIDHAAHQLAVATTEREKRDAWTLLKRLHALRTPVVIETMEIERGLR
jgi:hypothetical protein